MERRNRIVKQALKLRPMLVGYAYGLLRDHARAEDVVHEAYLVVMDKYEQFEEGTSLIAWCRTIVRYKISEVIRKESRLVSLEERILTDAIDGAFQLVQHDSQARQFNAMEEALEQCLTRLSNAHCALLHAFYHERYSYKEMAKLFEISIETVRKRLYRVRVDLRGCITKRLATEGAER